MRLEPHVQHLLHVTVTLCLRWPENWPPRTENGVNCGVVMVTHPVGNRKGSFPTLRSVNDLPWKRFGELGLASIFRGTLVIP